MLTELGRLLVLHLVPYSYSRLANLLAKLFELRQHITCEAKGADCADFDRDNFAP